MNDEMKNNPTTREKQLHGSFVEIVSRKEDCTVYRIADTTGEVVMTSYSVFPGINLIYNDVHMQECMIDSRPLKNIIEINHCREGRFECEFKEDYVYLGQGDMSIHLKNQAEQSSWFPLSHYHGISIMIDLAEASGCLSHMIEGVNIDLGGFVEKFCTASGCFVMRSKPCLEHIFSELYSVPDTIRYGYFKIKVLEVLLFLSTLEVDADKERNRHIQKTQVEIIKLIGKHLMKHIDEHITINQLSEIFGISETLLKTNFKKVYGVSVYSFIRSYKMQSAAFMLKNTDRNVLNIAGNVGYDNGSKFAKAFRDVMGVAPKEYRNQNV